MNVIVLSLMKQRQSFLMRLEEGLAEALFVAVKNAAALEEKLQSVRRELDEVRRELDADGSNGK